MNTKVNEKLQQNVALYVIYIIEDFARKNGLTERAAFGYLNRYKGIDFIEEYYDAEHMLPMEDAMKDITMVCRQNGGGIEL